MREAALSAKPEVSTQVACQGDRRRFSFLLVLVLAAFVLRVAVALVVQNTSVVSAFLTGDDQAYHRAAWEQAQAWRGTGTGVSAAERYLLNLYTYTEAVLYFLVGPHILAMTLVNCLLGALTAAIIYLMTRRLFGQVAAYCSGVAAAFFPSTLLWSALNLKEAMFIFGIAVLLWSLTELVTTGRQWLIVPILLSLAFVWGLRPYLLIVLSAVILGTVLLQSGRRMPRKWLTTAVLLLGCVAILRVSGAWDFYLSLTLPRVANQRYYAAAGAKSAFVPTPVLAASANTPVGTSGTVNVPAQGAVSGATSTSGGTTTSPGGVTTVPTPASAANGPTIAPTPASAANGPTIAPTPASAANEPTIAPTPANEVWSVIPSPDAESRRSIRNILAWAPTGLAFVLAAPFPWAAHRLVERLTIPEMLLWYAAVVLAVLGVAVHWRRWQRYLHLVGYIAAMVLVFIIIQGNLGTLVRQRGMIIPFTLVFSGAGMAWIWARWQVRRVVR